MLYVKEKIGVAEVRVALQYDNVFTVCPDCGKEHKVDLADFLADEDFDIEFSEIYCVECTAKRMMEREGL